MFSRCLFIQEFPDEFFLDNDISTVRTWCVGGENPGKQT